MILIFHGGGEGGHFFTAEADTGVVVDAADHTAVSILWC
jgi:hypothetical protein